MRRALFPAAAAIALLAAALSAAIALAGCGDSEPARTGADEPLRVTNGQFFEGALPVGTDGPAILTIESQNNLVVAGQVGKKLTGLAAKGAYSVALRFDDIGTGYWVVPVGASDPQTDGDLTWEAVYDLARDAPPGDHTLSISAADGAERHGPSSQLPLRIQGLVPEGSLVASLTWDTNADLDLHVVSPNGKELDPKHVTTAVGIDAGAGELPPGTGVLTRDSGASCVQDVRQEDVVWQDAPASGTYLFRVDMFSACGEPAATFKLDVYSGGALRASRTGKLLDIDADGGGAGTGLLVLKLHI